MLLHTSCAISGTGFLLSSEIVRENNGWKHHLLTEDIEFTIDSVIHGEKIVTVPTLCFTTNSPVPGINPGFSV